jgi:cation-transporting ATPase 13A3/4/5
MESVTKKNILYDGTKVVFVRDAEAIVIRTGFSSYKGQIFRNALLLNPVKVRFYKDAIKFLFLYGIIVFSIYFGFLWKMITLKLAFKLIFFR